MYMHFYKQAINEGTENRLFETSIALSGDIFSREIKKLLNFAHWRTPSIYFWGSKKSPYLNNYRIGIVTC